jgi:glycosyltransferase involved in cell wall biosynthesis
MRVLHIITNLGRGGAEKLVEQMVPLMGKRGNVEVEVLLLTDSGNVFTHRLCSNGVPLSVVSLRRPRHPLNAIHIRNHIVQGDYDIVHAHLFPTLYWVAFACCLLPKRRRPKLVYTEHSTHNRRREKKVFRFVEKIIYAKYDLILSVSDQVRANLTKWLGFGGEKFRVVENGIDLTLFRDALPYDIAEIVPGCGQNIRTLCMIARFSPSKDHVTAIRCMKLLPENVHLLLVGEGPTRAACERLVAELELRHRVHFLGFRKDVARILKTCDLAIVSSHWEGFGLAAVEAMAAGKPVIASNVPGLAEVVRDGGLLFKAGDYRALADTIMALLRDAQKNSELCQAGLHKSLSYDISNTVAEHLSIYQELMEV